MRVLLVASEVPPVASGVSRCVDQLARGLVDRGHHVELLSSADFPRIYLGEFRLSAMALNVRRLAREIASYDLVNLHGPAPTITDSLLTMRTLTPRSRRGALVYTHHCGIHLGGLEAPCSVYNSYHRGVAQSADHITVTTQAYRALTETRFGPPVSVVPWGVDYERFFVARPAPRRSGPLRVLFVGQMRPYKGIVNLMDAVAGEASLAVTIAGGGLKEAEYRRRAQAHANIHFLGRVDDDRLPGLYAEHDVVVLPSTTMAEAFGLTLLEGMSAGCAPVASDLPGVREVVGATGLPVQPGDVEALRRSLLELASDPERTWRMGQASQRRMSEMGWDEVARRFETVFESTLHGWRHRLVTRMLPGVWADPDGALAELIQRFMADWGSLVLFTGRRSHRLVAGWGRFASHGAPSSAPIAEYVARSRSPLLLSGRVAPKRVRPLLVRPDVASAVTVPVNVPGGALVVSLTRAPGEQPAFHGGDLSKLVRDVVLPR